MTKYFGPENIQKLLNRWLLVQTKLKSNDKNATRPQTVGYVNCACNYYTYINYVAKHELTKSKGISLAGSGRGIICLR